MTNQDAIVYLEGQWDCMCSEDCQIYTGHKGCPQEFICNDGQALQMAISALQAQGLQLTCNNLATDTISRQAAIDVIDGYMNKSIELHYLPTSDGIIKLISILPSAQPKPQKEGE